MKYEVELPDEVDRRLAQRASATGDDALHLIRVAVERFVAEAPATPSNGEWSEEGESRRRALIDKDIAGTISSQELAELADLDHLANEHFDRVAPPPFEGARQLHERLLKQRDNRN
ncbi:MAG TPA: hypothetical protein VFW87_22585 [Pirellulales bacterium]|nr:hypothetical protein [Pirellulales bacterium]